ncbi:MAG: RNA methyltransferase [Zoogloea sp.]|nr:RNA methyltransferase [Zoogloea sp.]
MKALASRDNPTVKRLHALATSGRDRRKLGQTLLDGAHLVTAARDAGWPLKELVISESGLARGEIAALAGSLSKLPAYLLPDSLFAHVSPVDAPSGIIAVIDLPAEAADAELRGSVIVLDGVQDSGNLGSILRTAAAAGIKDALLTPGCAQAWSPRVLRAGMGAHFVLDIHEHADPATRLAGYPGLVCATALVPGARPLYDCDLRGPVAWLFGAEGQGLSAEVAALATCMVTIPMPGAIESLNVGAAAAVCLFEQVRQQRSGLR